MYVKEYVVCFVCNFYCILSWERNGQFLIWMDEVRVFQLVCICIEDYYVFRCIVVVVFCDFRKVVFIFYSMFVEIVFSGNFDVCLNIRRIFVVNFFDFILKQVFMVLSVCCIVYFEYVIQFFNVVILNIEFFVEVEYGLVFCFYRYNVIVLWILIK